MKINKSEIARDVSNMFGIVRIRWSVRKYPANKNNKTSMYTSDSGTNLALLLDLNSLNISAIWFSVEFILSSFKQLQLDNI